jgi:hypothetical protein
VEAVKTGWHTRLFSYENPAMAGPMEPAAIAVTVRYAPVRGPEGVGWGVEPEGGGLGGGRDGTAGFREDGQGRSGECSSIRNELSVPDSVGRRRGLGSSKESCILIGAISLRYWVSTSLAEDGSLRSLDGLQGVHQA